MSALIYPLNLPYQCTGLSLHACTTGNEQPGIGMEAKLLELVKPIKDRQHTEMLLQLSFTTAILISVQSA